MPKSSTLQFAIGTNKTDSKQTKQFIIFLTVPKLNPVLHKKEQKVVALLSKK